MRNIVIFMLVLNVSYLLWILFGPENENRQQTVQVPQVDRDSLVLVSERVSNSEAVESSDVNLQTQQIYLCFSVGNFLDLDDANGFRATVESGNIESTLNISQSLAEVSFLVYLPPFSSAEIAEVSLQAVDAAIRDAELEIESQRLTSGDFLNGIGFGSYQSEAEAVELRTQLAELGYRANIEEFQNEDSVVRVLVRAPENARFETVLWPRIQAERPYLNRTENLCETIAQGTQFP